MQNFSKFLELANSQAYLNQAADSHNSYDNRIYITQENASRTIYVADLPKSISYLELSEFFEANAGPCHITIKRPMFKNFYYAFVQFQRKDHAQKILTEQRYPEFAGHVCRVLPFYKFAVSAQQQSSVAAAKEGPSASAPSVSTKMQRDCFNLFIKGIPQDWTHDKLSKSFEQFGKVISAKISIDANFSSRGYGFVSFASEAEGQKAIKAFNGMSHDQLAAKNQSDRSDDQSAEETKVSSKSSDSGEKSTKVMTVTEYVPKLDRDGTHMAKTKTNLYVKNFPCDDFSDEQLKELFEPFGEVTSAVVMRDETTNKSRGFGFVCFKDWRDAQKAVEKYSSSEKGAAQPAEDNESSEEKKADSSKPRVGLYVTEAKTKEERQAELAKSTYQWKRSMQYLNLIVRNLDPETTQEEFDNLFSNFGEIRTSRLHQESGLGFVCFGDRESAQKAKMCQNLQLRNRPITANYCEPREARQKYLEEKWDKKAFERFRSTQTSKTSNQDLLQLITSLGMLFNQIQQQSLQSQHHHHRVPGMANYGNGYHHANGNGFRANNGSSRHFGPAAHQMQQPQQVAPMQNAMMPPAAQQQMSHQPPGNNGNNSQQMQASHQNHNSGNQHQQQFYRPRGGQHNHGAQGQNGNQRMIGQPQPMPEPMAMPTAGMQTGQSQTAPMPPIGQPLQAPHPVQNTQVPPVLQPELMVASGNYRSEIFQLFNSQQFMQATKDEHRKQMVGTSIYKHVISMAGEELAPKITGMIIDLPLADLNYSVSTLDNLTHKVRSAVQLLLETKNVNQAIVEKMPMNGQSGAQQANQPNQAVKA